MSEQQQAEAHTWTGRAREWMLVKLPPDKLLPEDQPSYVASRIYVFGMGAIGSLVYVIVSGVILSLNGPAWYHVSDFGHFVNSSHLWSVELFFVFMVVHLWGKYWIAAWRGGRVLTWITGVISFAVSIVAAFTGYLLQTNFDSQWIAFEAKDALNAIGVGAWFNVANLGQIFMWHIVLLPLAVGAVVVLHVLLVRMKGVVPPLEAAETDAQLRGSLPESSAATPAAAAAQTEKRPSVSWRSKDDIATRAWTGKKREYDLFKELTVGVIVVGVLVVGLSAVFSSPDEHSVTLQQWAQQAPADFITTTVAELGGTSDTAGYGPPYNTTANATQTVGPIDLQSFSGARIPIDTAMDFLTGPLGKLPNPPATLAVWNRASEKQQATWAHAYPDAITAAPDADPAQVADGDYGPVPALATALQQTAKAGALDGVIQNESGFFNTDYTKSILFLGDGQYFVNLANNSHLTGDQWGMMNETGNYPGQSWLWLFSFWYQIPAIGEAPNADVLVVGIMLLLTLLLALVPFIPGLRTIPRWIPLHRLVWKDYYRKR